MRPFFRTALFIMVELRNKALTLACCIGMSTIAICQVGGDNVYGFLNFPSNAYSASMGGSMISVRARNINLLADNPALLDSTMHNDISLGYINYFSGINMGYAAYARKFRKVGTLAWGLQYLNYGAFTLTDATGLEIGTFTAGDYALITSYARPILVDSLFSVGGNLKVIYSTLEQYQSAALAADLGASYRSRNKNFSIGLVLRNIGTQIKAYTADNREPLPFDMQLGISKRMGHAPLRLTLLAHHLHIWDMTYNDPEVNPVEIDPVTGEAVEKLITMDKLMRHFVIGGEFMPTRNINVRLSYNHQRKKELALASRGGMVGISLGLGVKIYRFKLDYARAVYHLAGASNHITLTTNIRELTKSSKPKTKTQSAP